MYNNIHIVYDREKSITLMYKLWGHLTENVTEEKCVEIRYCTRTDKQARAYRTQIHTIDIRILVKKKKKDAFLFR